MKIGTVTVKHPKIFTQYAQWLGRQMTEGRSLAAHNCTACNSQLFAMLPPVGDCSDSLANCPVCDALFFRVVNNTSGDPVVIVHSMKNSPEGASHE